MTADASQFELVAGGLPPETELFTTTGLTSVAALSVGDHVYTMNPATRLVKCKPVTAIQCNQYEGELVALETKRADLRISPAQPIPYQTKDIQYPRFQAASDLDERRYYKFINEWRRLPNDRLESVDITDFVEAYEICAQSDDHGHTFRAELPDGCEPVRRNSHTGYYFDSTTFKRYQAPIEAAADQVTIHAGPNHHLRPYQFDGDDFLRFLGWYVTEGSVYQPTDRDTTQVLIAQETPKHRRAIAALFDRMDIDVNCSARRFGFGSKVFGDLLERLCGTGSREKHLPEFVWELCADQQQLLLDVLLAGDGNDRQTYYTASNRLAADVCRLSLELGMKPRYTRRNGIWQVYVRWVNDGFHSAQHVSRQVVQTDLYRLTLEDYPVLIAGRNGKFQWVGVSGVS